jgi:hypothetical protein
MMDFVQEYLDGVRNRVDFDLDFNHYLIENYAKMEREGGELADCFQFYLAEEGLILMVCCQCRVAFACVRRKSPRLPLTRYIEWLFMSGRLAHATSDRRLCHVRIINFYNFVGDVLHIACI